jgi:hypothetical protein
LGLGISSGFAIMAVMSPSSFFVLSSLWLTVLPGAFDGQAAPAPEVVNFKDREVVRHPVVLVRGTVEEGATTVATRTRHRGVPAPVAGRGVVRNGAFKALVELGPGENVIEFTSDRSASPRRLVLMYQPQTNLHYVRLIWLADADGQADFAVPDENVPQTAEARLRTAGLLLQCFTAERMHELGYGRRTFRLETDSRGQVVVHTLRAPKPAAHYHAIANDLDFWGEINQFLDFRHRDPMAKNMVLASFTRKDPATGKMLAHTALGGGALGLFGSASFFSWPESVGQAQDAFLDERAYDTTRVHDDSVDRGVRWALASTTMGATLHEMGHTFGLPHCLDSRCIMTRGFDHLNRFFTLHDPPHRGRGVREFKPDEEAYFAPVSASFLRWSPWFRLDRTRDSGGDGPTLEINPRKQQVEVTGRAKLQWLGFWEKGDIRAFRELKDAPRKTSLSLEEINRLMDGQPTSKVTAVDENGRVGELKLP